MRKLSALLKKFTNTWTVLAAVLLVLGSGPLVVGGLLDSLGIVDLGNGLGFGLLHILTLPFAIVCFAVGLARANRAATTPR